MSVTRALIVIIFCTLIQQPTLSKASAYVPSSGVHGHASSLIDAIDVASSKYSVILQKERMAYDWEFADYVADINNYNIGASEGGGLYVVVFRIRGRNFNGGGADFYINKQDFRVVKVIRYK